MRPLAHASRPQPLLGVSTGVQQLEAFSLVEPAGAFIQPLRMLLRQTQINVVSPPCVSWVSIPRGSEKGSWGVARGKAPVNLDKREQPCPVDKLSTRECSDACLS